MSNAEEGKRNDLDALSSQTLDNVTGGTYKSSCNSDFKYCPTCRVTVVAWRTSNGDYACLNGHIIERAHN